MTARSVKPTVWIEPKPPKPGPYRIRAEIHGRRLPDIPVGMSARHAEHKRAEREAALWAGKLGISTVEKQSRTLAQFREEYLAGMVSTVKADNTIRIARKALEHLEAFVGATTPIVTIDRGMVEKWRGWLLKRQYSRGKKGKLRTASSNDARINMRTAATAFRKALKDEAIDRDPFFGVEQPPEVDVAHPPTPEEVHLLWKQLAPRAQRAIAAAAFMGLRRSELLWLHGPKSKAESRLIPPAAAGEPWIARVRKAKTRRGKTEYKELAVPPEALAAMEPIPRTARCSSCRRVCYHLICRRRVSVPAWAGFASTTSATVGPPSS
jgi:hypothetical protein